MIPGFIRSVFRRTDWEFKECDGTGRTGNMRLGTRVCHSCGRATVMWNQQFLALPHMDFRVQWPVRRWRWQKAPDG